MTLAEACIRRPVLSIVLSVAIVLFGAVSFFSLGVREYPAVDPPVVTVTTNYPGANPEVVDAQITEPLEQALAGIAGVKNVFSTSREASSSIRIEFELSVDLDDAANDVRDKVAGAIGRLPSDVDPPIVEKADADSSPIVFMTVRSDTQSILDVSHIANTRIKDKVQTIPGVSTVRIFGEKRYSMRVWLDADKMSSHEITPEDVRTKLGAWNVDLPSGRVEGRNMEVAVRTEGRLETPREFSRLTLKDGDGHAVRLEDVAETELGPLNARAGVKRLGQTVVGVAVIPQPNTNAIAIADEFYKRFEEIQKTLPEEYTVEVGYDFTKYVRKSVLEVEETLLIAFILVAIVIYIFLRDWRASVIPVVAIPVSIIATFALVKLFGFSINVLTLVGIVLSIGLVCDDAIVVLETIYSKIEKGMTPLAASIAGANEIFFAIVSTTITLAVVFMPIVFVSGLTGRLFREFAVVVVGSVLISGFVALTLSPMMCRFLLKGHGHQSWFYRVTEPWLDALTSGYRFLLVKFMSVRIVAPAILVLVVVWSYQLFNRVPSELAPLEDRANIRVNIRGPEGATYNYTEHQLDLLAAYVDENIPETSRTYSIIGGFGGVGSPNTGVQNIYLTETGERTRSQEEIFRQVSKSMGSFDGIMAFPAQPPTIGSRFAGQPIQLVIQSPTVDELQEVLPQVLEKARARPELRFVDVDLRFNRPQLSVSVDRDRASELGVSALDVGRALQLGLGGVRYGYFIMEGKQYEIIGQFKETDRDEPTDLSRIFVRAQGGEMIPLSAVVSSKEVAGPAALFRYDRTIAATVSAGLGEGRTLGEGIAAIQEAANEVIPPQMSTALAGESRDYAESSSSTTLAFGFAVLLIYLVLAALFESFRDPLVILMTVPLSLAGALASLDFTGQTMNVFSRIGIIMLVGLVTKNGILVVEFANHKRREGLPLADACIDGAVERFRPILMTTLATILGVLPIALSLGGAAGSRKSLGIAVVGGLGFSLVLTLFLVPAMHAIIAKRKLTTDDEPAPTHPGVPEPVPAE